MSNLLTIEQRQAFEEQGYLLVQGILDEHSFYWQIHGAMMD